MREKYRVGDVVWATVLEVLPNGALLRLDEATSGFLPLSETAEGEKATAFAAGAELLVKVVGYDRLGRPIVSLRRVTEADREEAEFHREAVTFRSLLSNRVLPVMEKREPEEGVERRLARWIPQAQAALRRRRNRPLPVFSEEDEE
jgi:predicted RNA-binding protein with RPS1 domain